MMMRVLFVFITLLFSTGCNTAFFVSKDDIIRKDEGYILIVPHHYVEFIPSKIDTSLSLTQNLEGHKLGKAFYLPKLSHVELNYLKIYADTIGFGWLIIPVRIEYRQKKQVNRQLRIQEREYHDHFIKVENKTYHYKVKEPSINLRYISAFPYLSEAVMSRKSLIYMMQNPQ